MMKLIALHRIERKNSKGQLEAVEPGAEFEANNEDGKKLIESAAAREPGKSAGRKVTSQAVRSEAVANLPPQEKGGKAAETK